MNCKMKSWHQTPPFINFRVNSRLYFMAHVSKDSRGALGKLPDCDNQTIGSDTMCIVHRDHDFNEYFEDRFTLDFLDYTNETSLNWPSLENKRYSTALKAAHKTGWTEADVQTTEFY